ncbi:MAG: lipoprotein-releasing system transmembrane subunit LolC, partial [Elusimicrobia bacterium]|nr:lipoprotein-releasing system transmembrane subunit LolC [Elusimicrobiota bacterium]
MPFELFIALRYLKGNRHTLGGLLTSAIAVGGVMVGVAALIATLAVMTGFREDIRNKILGAQPHL